MIAPLPRGHRVDDRHHAPDCLVLARRRVRRQLFQALPARQQVKDLLQGAQLGHLLELVPKVLERQGVCAQLPGHRLGLVPIDHLLRLLDQRHGITHPQDARGHPVRVEGFQGVKFLARAKKLDRLARHGLDGEHRPAAGIPLHFGQDHPRQPHAPVELLSHGNRILPDHRIGDQQHFVRGDLGANRHQFVHQLIIDVEAAPRVQNRHVKSLGAGPLDPVHADGDGIQARRVAVVHRHAERRSQGHQLFHRRRPARVGRHQEDAPAMRFEMPRQLAARGRLARTLETHHQDDGGRHGGESQSRVLLSHEGTELLPDDLHHLVPRRQALLHLLADRLDADPLDEFLDDREVDVSLEERQAHFFKGLGNRGLVQDAMAPETLQNPVKFG